MTCVHTTQRILLGMLHVRCHLCFAGGWVLAALTACVVDMQKNWRPAACFCGTQSCYDVSLRMTQKAKHSRAVFRSCFVLEAWCAVPGINRISMVDALRHAGGAIFNANCKLWACRCRQQHRVWACHYQQQHRVL